MTRYAFALVAATQLGCSALGLTVDVPQCTAHADCDALNEAMGIGADECFRYVCIGDPMRVCERAIRDLDNDGHPAAACAGDPMCGSDCDDCDDGDDRAHPGLDEACDGVDNDCDLLVDNVAGGAAAPPMSTLVSGTDTVEWASYGAGLAGSGVEPIAFGGRATFFNVALREGEAETAQQMQFAGANVLERNMNAIELRCPTSTTIRTRSYADDFPGGSPSGPTMCQLDADCDNGNFCDGFERCVHASPDADANGCRPSIGGIENACTDLEFCHESTHECEEVQFSGCTFQGLAVAETSTAGGQARWLGVAIEQQPCGAPGPGGTVRVGYFTETMGDMNLDPGRNLLQRGDLARSSSFRGIDLDANGCTGASRGGAPGGAHLPAIAALPADPSEQRRRPQGLAAWIGSPGEGPGPVELMGVWHEEFGAAPNVVEWVNGSGASVPERLPTAALGDVAPVVRAFTGDSAAGYVVGYGSSNSVVLRFVPALADPEGTAPVSPFGIDPPRDDLRASPNITELGTDVTLAARGGARSVDLAISNATANSAQVGVAWQDDDGVHFAIFELDAATGAITAPSTAVMVFPMGEQVTIAFSDSGLVLEGYEGADGPAEASTLGGWLVAWTSGVQTLGARFAVLDGSRLPPETMVLGSTHALIDVFVDRQEDAEGVLRPVPRLAYHDPAAMAFRALDAFCGPPM